MEAVKVFDFEDSKVRTVIIDNEPYFVGKDVANILGYKDINRAVKQHVDKDDIKSLSYKAYGDLYTSFWGNKNDFTDKVVINESGLYSLIISSKLPSAKKFKRWITHDVLPSIRKTGSYQIRPEYKIPQSFSEALQLAADQAKQLEITQPKADYYDLSMHNPGLITTTIIAKSYGMTAAKFNKLLKDLDIIYKVGKKWVLHKQYQDKGYADYETWNNANDDQVHPLLKWTMRGRKFLYDFLKEVAHLEPVIANQ